MIETRYDFETEAQVEIFERCLDKLLAELPYLDIRYATFQTTITVTMPDLEWIEAALYVCQAIIMRES